VEKIIRNAPMMLRSRFAANNMTAVLPTEKIAHRYGIVKQHGFRAGVFIADLLPQNNTATK